jgi:hypothetical protein
MRRLFRWLRSDVDGVDALTLSLAVARYAAFVAWAEVIVRAIRGEDSEENWKTFSSSVVLISLSALQSGAEIREFASLRGAAVEMRGLVHDAAAQADLRERRAIERDRQSRKQQATMLLINKGMIVLAALTLSAAIVTLAVTVAR